MGYTQALEQKRRCFAKYASFIFAIFLVASPCRAQSIPAVQQPQQAWAQDLNKYPGLLDEFGRFYQKLQSHIQFPAERAESRLLPLLPPPTIFYVAIPNYGDVVHQTLDDFRHELKESSVLRNWWEHGELAADGPKILDFFEKLHQLHQYLGGEIVVSATMAGREPTLLIVAEVRKPGLKKFLQQLASPVVGSSHPDVRVMDPQELSTAQDTGSSQKPLVLVRPDFVVAAFDLATLRGFSARLDQSSREFVSTPFGQRVAHEYEGGVSTLAAADLHEILRQVPPGTQQDATFEHSGFADMKYLVWEHRSIAGQTVGQAELSFTAPRHGTASWLARSGPLTSLDFVSPKAMLAATVVLTNPSQMFDDYKELVSASNSNPFAGLAQMEQMLRLSLKDDLLRYLTGELTVELDNAAPPQPVWKAILKIKDAARLQQTLATLFTATHFQAQPFDDAGVTYYTLRVPSPKATLEIGYAFVDGHLIVASSRDVVADAIRLHRSGGSLAKSPKLLAALPPGHTLEASALFYQDPIAMAALRMGQFAPQMAESLAQFAAETTPAVVCLYGEESAIREASRSGAFDVGAALVVAAIAIPNLVRSRIAANEASAVGTIRTLITAEVTYAATYPQKGFAPDLATLGPDPFKPNAVSARHAGLLNETLANETCAADAWCVKSGYRFRIAASCKQKLCKEFVAMATPVDTNTGTRSFCAASDGVIRSKAGSPLTLPAGASECQAWPPLQ